MPRRSLPIRQLASRRWQARPAGVDPATFATYEEAEVWVLERLAERRKGIAPALGTSKVTFRQYAEGWQQGMPWAESTRDRVTSSLVNHLYPAIGDVPLVQLRKDPLQEVITHLAKRSGGPLGANTARAVLQHLNQVLNAAVDNGNLARNPAKGVQAPPGEGKAIVVPTVEQVQALAEAIDPPSRALIAVGAGLGLRQGEAFALHRSSVNFMKGTVRVEAKVRADKAGRLHRDDFTKTRKDRDVPLPSTVANELALHIEQYGVGADGLLFTNPDGSLLYHHRWNDGPWREAAVAVGLPQATFHCLRHFCATTLLRNKVSVAAVARALGDQQATILKYYSHWIDEDTEVIRGVLDGVLSTPGNTENKEALGGS